MCTSVPATAMQVYMYIKIPSAASRWPFLMGHSTTCLPSHHPVQTSTILSFDPHGGSQDSPRARSLNATLQPPRGEGGRRETPLLLLVSAPPHVFGAAPSPPTPPSPRPASPCILTPYTGNNRVITVVYCSDRYMSRLEESHLSVAVRTRSTRMDATARHKPWMFLESLGTSSNILNASEASKPRRETTGCILAVCES